MIRMTSNKTGVCRYTELGLCLFILKYKIPKYYTVTRYVLFYVNMTAASAGMMTKLQHTVMSPYTMIQGIRRQYWYLSLNFILCLQVSGTGKKDPFFLKPARPPTFTRARIQNITVKNINGARSLNKKNIAMLRRTRLVRLMQNTIFAPVVILISQGPQQQGWDTTHHQHHITDMMSLIS